jgi:uncharacterized protein (DUF3084 family)
MGAYGVLLIAALVVVSGIIAYIGDILGRWMGKRRMTLFNLRPRHTAIITSIIAGMAIAALTLGSAMAVSENVRDGLTKVGSLRGQNLSLRRQQRTLSRQLEATDKGLKEANQRLSRLTGNLAALEKQVKEARTKLAAAKTELSDKRAEVDRVEKKSMEILAKQYREAEQLELWRERALRAFERVYTKPVIYQANEPLLAGTIDGNQTKYAIARELREFVTLVSEAAAKAGAGQTEDGRAITIFKLASEKGEVKQYGEAEIINLLTDGIAETKGPVIVRAFSVGNAVQGEPVLVDFELFRNERVFAKGDAIARTRVDSSPSQSQLLFELIQLLRGKVAEAARAKGVMPSLPRKLGPATVSLIPDPHQSVGQISYDDMLAAIAKIKQAGGVVTVVARAAQDTWTAGPLEVELTVES